MTKFLNEPPKMRTAAGVIVTATLVVVVGGGALFRVLDHREYQTIWTGMWFALQTVTTVGYGDVTPKNASGKIVAALIMLEGVAFLAIVTAAITSTFVARAARERLATGRKPRRTTPAGSMNASTPSQNNSTASSRQSTALPNRTPIARVNSARTFHETP